MDSARARARNAHHVPPLPSADRLSTIRDADQIAVVNKGRVVETGTHEVLRDKRGLYAELLSASVEPTQKV